MIVSADLLQRAGVRTPAAWTGPLTSATQAFGITTAPRMAGFLANVLHESGNLTVLVENLNYSPAGLMQTWPSRFDLAAAQRMGRTITHDADQFHIAERAYGGRMGNGPDGSGDGWAFRGRGLIQITGRSNYTAGAKAAGVGLGQFPAWLESPFGACTSAARFWHDAGCNEMLDAGRIRDARVKLNGGQIGLDDVLARYAVLLPLLGGKAAPVPANSKPSAAPSESDRLNDQQLARPA